MSSCFEDGSGATCPGVRGGGRRVSDSMTSNAVVALRIGAGAHGGCVPRDAYVPFPA